VPKIGSVLILILLILVGVIVIGLSVAVLRPRQAPQARKGRDLDLEEGESEVYERLYGKRSTTVSAAVPVERPPEADVDGPQSDLRE
jgi:hypothetical protein